ncbi:unnamed protein product, partial [Didymodactylos carnosus]
MFTRIVHLFIDYFRWPIDQPMLDTYEETNPQAFICLWFREFKIMPNYPDIEKNLNSIFKTLKVFISDRVELIGFIGEWKKSDINQKIICIITHSLDTCIVDCIGEQDIVHKMYIQKKHHDDDNHYERWMDAHKNSCEMFTEYDSTLYSILAQELDNQNNKEISNNCSRISEVKIFLPPFGMFSSDIKENSIRNVSKESIAFIWFQLLIKILLHIVHTDDAKYEMIEECQTYYQDNEIELRKISSFEEDYKSKKAIWWYTADTFLFRLMNKAFRSEDIDKIFIFRLFISDLHKQLSEEITNQKINEPTSLKLYRGKKLFSTVIYKLKNSINQLISMNGFLSATSDIDVARSYAGDGYPRLGYETVLFELDINTNHQRESFVDITKSSCYKDEGEVLFLIGTIWRIISVEKNKDENRWHVNLKLTTETKETSIELINILNEHFAEPCTLLTLANILLELGESDKAIKYYTKALKDCMPDDEEQKDIIYNNLGILYYEMNQPHLAFLYFEKTKISKSYSPLSDDICLRRKTSCEQLKGINQQIARSYYKNTHRIVLKGLPARHSSLIKLYNNRGLVHHKCGNYDEALKDYEEALEHASRDDSLEAKQDCSAIYNNIGAYAAAGLLKAGLHDKGQFYVLPQEGRVVES